LPAYQDDFVNPDTHTLNLSGVDRWVEVKKELTVGEQKRLESLPITSLKGDQSDADNREVGLNWSAYYLGKLEIYLVDWSLRGRDGKVIPLSKANIHGLKQATAEEITVALDAYLEETARAEGKARGMTPTPTNVIEGHAITVTPRTGVSATRNVIG